MIKLKMLGKGKYKKIKKLKLNHMNKKMIANKKI
jgi:hypothetical protein